jgi:hypothetical protein
MLGLVRFKRVSLSEVGAVHGLGQIEEFGSGARESSVPITRAHRPDPWIRELGIWLLAYSL